MTAFDVAAALRAVWQKPTADAIDALLALIARADDDALTAVAAALRTEERAHKDEERGAAARMGLGASLARRAQLRGDAAGGSVDDVVAALNALAAEPDEEAREARFAPLGAYLLARDVPAYVDMRVTTDPDDTVFSWTSGAMALRTSLAAG